MAKGEMTVKVTAADLPVVRANVRALDIVIGLKLVEYLAERIRKDDELARAEEEIQATGAGAYNGGNSKCYVETADKLPEEAGTAKAPARKRAGVKTAARVAAAGKKTVAQTRKKATGAADGK